ncbi:hypothetical protein AVEN_187568-1 [Araneus ventricosus]|uniref:Uncharacterized protein n=1 Tax=Araneus ventricosus TaxID=182803 RepID=A0A4Y2US44_ARAVE|nr:hypothetical protein AVEN_187568-1 [Araneus ventricosus]
MEKQQYILNLPLKQMALRKVAIVLWHQADILAHVKSFRCQSLTCDSTIQQWQKSVENVVKEKVSMLLLPDSLKEELVHVMKPIGPEILKWKLHHESLISDSYFALDQLFWTSVGTVDYRKTAEIFIRQERITIVSSYKLACIYCLDDHIRVIWEKLSEDSKKLFYDEENILQIRQPELVVFWTYLIRGEVAKLDVLINRNNNGERERTVYQYAFESAATSGNKAATEYFFQKLTLEEREASLLETAQSLTDKRCFDGYSYTYDLQTQNFCDVLCYLLSQMKEEEQMQVFKKHPYKTLRCFMDWPWQDLFMKVVAFQWSFLRDDEYKWLMGILSQNRTMSGYNYPKLFGELFLHSPSRYRKYIIDQHRVYGFWFRNLIYGGHTEIIKLVLRNVDDKDRQGFIICETGFHLSWRLIEEGKWFLLDLFVSECRLSSEAKTILKNSFMRYVARFYKECQNKLRRHKWERFFQLIDNANVNDGNKRIIEEAEKEEQSISNKPKRKRRRRKF